VIGCAVAQLHLRKIDLRLIGVHGTPILLDERRLSIELLVSHRILGDQTVIALEIELRIIEQRLILDFHRLRLRERRRIGTRINLGDDVPGVDLLALGEIHLEDLAVHPALDQNAIEGLHRAQGRKINRHVGVCGQVGHYGDAGRGRRRLCWGAAVPSTRNQAKPEPTGRRKAER
jgi:hypothetical protein